jgi:hypothetical protein
VFEIRQNYLFWLLHFFSNFEARCARTAQNTGIGKRYLGLNLASINGQYYRFAKTLHSTVHPNALTSTPEPYERNCEKIQPKKAYIYIFLDI